MSGGIQTSSRNGGKQKGDPSAEAEDGETVQQKQGKKAEAGRCSASHGREKTAPGRAAV